MNLRKGRDGWEATTELDMPDVVAFGGREGGREGKTVLQIQTGKGQRQHIRTRAAVIWRGDGFMTHAFGLGSGTGDYSSTVVQRMTRCTEKTVKELHDEALLQTDAILAQARAFYALQKAGA